MSLKNIIVKTLRKIREDDLIEEEDKKYSQRFSDGNFDYNLIKTKENENKIAKILLEYRNNFKGYLSFKNVKNFTGFLSSKGIKYIIQPVYFTIHGKKSDNPTDFKFYDIFI